MNTITKRYAAGLAIAAAITSFAIALPAFAQSNGQGPNGQGDNGNHYGWMKQGEDHGPGSRMATSTRMMNGERPAVVGTVTAVNGSTLTVASHGFGKNTATTTYSVNASNATVYKNNATSTLSNVAVNDRVMVMGTVSGTSVTATVIREGIPMMMRGRGPGQPENGGTGQSLPFKGNGEPVVAGTVSSVNGNSITITTGSNTSYTIDAASSTVTKNNASSTVSSIATGDYVIVQGTINGSNVAASTILDGQSRQAPGNAQANGQKPGNGSGFFGAIGSFFKKIFGF